MWARATRLLPPHRLQLIPPDERCVQLPFQLLAAGIQPHDRRSATPVDVGSGESGMQLFPLLLQGFDPGRKRFQLPCLFEGKLARPFGLALAGFSLHAAQCV